MLEFRLFEGESEIGKLVGHVFTALDIIHKTANEVFREEGGLETVNSKENTYSNTFNATNAYLKHMYGGRRNMLKTKKRNHKRTYHTRRKQT